MNGPEPNSPSPANARPPVSEHSIELLPPQPIAESFEDPGVYQAFVSSLYAGIERKLDGPINNDIALEIAGLTRLLNVMPAAAVQQNRVFFELAFKLLQADQPNLFLVKSIRRDLSAVNDRYVGGFSRFLLFASGKTQLNAILSALFTIFLLSFVFIIVMSGGVKLMFTAAGDASSDMRLLAVLKGPSFNELLLMAHAAFLGSVVSIMARIKAFLADASLTPLMMYVSVVTRPILSVLVSVLAFCTIKSGMVSFHGIDLDGANGYYVAWGIGFLCGFSERLAQNFVVAAGNTLDGSAPTPSSPGPTS